jgi:hypothetical protein
MAVSETLSTGPALSYAKWWMLVTWDENPDKDSLNTN